MNEPIYVDEKLCRAFQARIEERLDGMDIALTAASKELERRLHELNDLRASFEHRITIIETRAVTWTAAIGVAFVLLQLALHFLK